MIVKAEKLLDMSALEADLRLTLEEVKASVSSSDAGAELDGCCSVGSCRN